MDFTTTTKLARNGKKEFDHGIKVVLYNNQDIGLVVGQDVYTYMKNSGLIEQLREEMREAQDAVTVDLVHKDAAHDRTAAITFDAFKQKYAL